LKWWQNKTKLGDIAAKDYLLSSLSRVHTFFRNTITVTFLLYHQLIPESPTKPLHEEKTLLTNFLKKTTHTQQQRSSEQLWTWYLRLYNLSSVQPWKPTLTEKIPSFFVLSPIIRTRKAADFYCFLWQGLAFFHTEWHIISLLFSSWSSISSSIAFFLFSMLMAQKPTKQQQQLPKIMM